MQPAHPLGVALGEVVVDGDEVHALAGERVEVERQRGDEGLALTGLHLGDPAEVQRRAAHHLDVEVALAERARGRLADGGERLGEQVVEEIDLGVVVGRLVEALAEVARERAELGVGASLHLRLERADARRNRLEDLELPAFAGVQELVEQAHEAINATGEEAAAGRHRAYATMQAMGTATGDRRLARSRAEAATGGGIARRPTPAARRPRPRDRARDRDRRLGPDLLGPRRI